MSFIYNQNHSFQSPNRSPIHKPRILMEKLPHYAATFFSRSRIQRWPNWRSWPLVSRFYTPTSPPYLDPEQQALLGSGRIFQFCWTCCNVKCGCQVSFSLFFALLRSYTIEGLIYSKVSSLDINSGYVYNRHRCQHVRCGECEMQVLYS
jgi:hypothetical protein